MNFSANLDAIGILTITVDIDADVDLNAIRDTLRGKVSAPPSGERFTYGDRTLWAVPEHVHESCRGCVFVGQGCPTDSEQREQLGQTCLEGNYIFVGALT